MEVRNKKIVYVVLSFALVAMAAMAGPVAAEDNEGEETNDSPNASAEYSVRAEDMSEAGDEISRKIVMPALTHEDDDGTTETTKCSCDVWGSDCSITCGDQDSEQTEGQTYACCWREQKDWSLDECHCACTSGPTECKTWAEKDSGDNGYSMMETEDVES